ncbi:MAG TPA: twin-arginine translocation signal domain-containing protein [Burkholderiales bacterium]|nr:twin-arginine translocation signal domain-containing protein [Burkholderiales bacterium]
MPDSKSKLSRRNFLLAVGVGSAGAAAVMVAKSLPQAGSKAEAGDDAKGAGYHVSEHIRNYYRTTEV